MTSLIRNPRYAPRPTGYAPGGVTYQGPHGVPARPVRRPTPAPGLGQTTAADPYAAQAMGLLNPALRAAVEAITGRAKGGAAAISGYTSALAKDLAGGPDRVAGIYDPALASGAAIENSLANRLSGEGDKLSGELAARLGSINAPAATDPALAAVKQAGTGAGNASYGKGAASLQDLVGRKATGMEYAGKLPGIARQGGLQQLGALEGQAGRDIADASTQILGQLPGIATGLRGDAEQRRQFNASQGENKRQFDLSQKQQMLLARMANETDSKKAAQDWAEFQASFNQKASQAAVQAGRPNAALSNANGYLTDSDGNPVTDATGNLRILPGFKLDPATGQVVKVSGASKKAAPQLTAAQVQKYKGIAATISEQARHGFNEPDVIDPQTGKPREHPPITYEQALDEMRKSGVPDSIAIPALKRWYSVQGNGVAVGADVNPRTNPAAKGPPAPKR